MFVAQISLIALLLFGLSLPGVRSQTSPAASAARCVVVISVDGMSAEFYTHPPANLRTPNLARFKSEGSFAEGVLGVYPTLTYPSHTTIVTGRLPAEHGIYTNLSSREADKRPNDWFWYANAIKVRTLWDKAREAHLSTAAISWPVTVGAAIDWDIPEIWDPDKGEVGDPIYVSKFLNPVFALEMLAVLGPPQPGADTDVTRTRLAAYILAQHKPNLLLVHLAEPDHTEHHEGPRSAQALAAVERADTRIGEILAAIKEAGLGNSTDIFIVSDHGFLPVKNEINPNVLLAKAGLLTLNNNGAITGGKVTTVNNGGSFFIYWPDAENLRGRVDAALRPLRDQGLLWAVFDRRALLDMGVEPAVQLALEAPEGFAFGDDATGEFTNGLYKLSGTHGFLPFRSGLEASLIAWGPRIKSGINLHRILMTAIGPTLLKDLGIDDPQFGSTPPLSEIFK